MLLPDVTLCEAGVAVTAKSAAEPGAATVAVPLRALVCGEPGALSVTETAALKLPTEAGLKVTETAQVAEAARFAPQVLELMVKAVGLGPVSLMPEMLSVAVPLLVSVVI